MDRPLDAESTELQTQLDQLAGRLGVRFTPVGLHTNDGLNVYFGDDGLYHFAYYERGRLSYDSAGTLDDVLYRYCESIVSSDAARWSDRKERFQYEFNVLSGINPEWAKRRVRELAASFRETRPDEQTPKGILLLPDIGEQL